VTDHGITGKAVLITGGAKNLGGRLARDLAEHGAMADAIHYNSAATRPDAEATVAAIVASDAKAAAFQADLTTAAATARLFADADAVIGCPDIAINTVGRVLKRPITEISEAEYDEMSAVNAKSAFFVPQEGGPARQRQRQGEDWWMTGQTILVTGVKPRNDRAHAVRPGAAPGQAIRISAVVRSRRWRSAWPRSASPARAGVWQKRER
jgi:NAD(P)-dependent dehydrogenase (short-subunit alcohol dehydrogenase family)